MKIIATLLLLLAFVPQVQAECTCSEAPSLKLEITAAYPMPKTGEKEWVELKNLDTISLDLANYTLEDNTAKPWTMEGNLASGASLQISGFPFALNNGEDLVTLKTIDGIWIDTLNYTGAKEGIAMTKNSSSTAETTTQNTSTSTSTTPSTTPSLWPEFSEAMPNPEGSDSTEEWIELYNPHDSTLSLDGLYLDDEDGGSSPHALTGTLAAESYLLISIQDSKLTLNNSTDHVRLLGINQEILWDINYAGGKEGESYAQFGATAEWTDSPTPGENNAIENSEAVEIETQTESENSTENPEYNNGDLSESIELTEVFPNPEGPDQEEEWIEITNGGTESVNLGNWTLDDGPGGSKPYTFSDDTIIEPGQTLLVDRGESKIALNNSNETVQLSDFEGSSVDEIHYESSIEDQSYSKIDIEETSSTQASSTELGARILSTWQWVAPSPGVVNPKWKQFKGSISSIEDGLITLYDGISNWSLKTEDSQLDSVLYQIGNQILVQAVQDGEFYKITHSELVQSVTAAEPKTTQPWGWIAGGLAGLAWMSFEFYKKHKNRSSFDPHFTD